MFESFFSENTIWNQTKKIIINAFIEKNNPIVLFLIISELHNFWFSVWKLKGKVITKQFLSFLEEKKERLT